MGFDSVGCGVSRISSGIIASLSFENTQTWIVRQEMDSRVSLTVADSVFSSRTPSSPYFSRNKRKSSSAKEGVKISTPAKSKTISWSELEPLVIWTTRR